MKVNETILSEARQATEEFEKKYEEYLTLLEQEEKLLEEFNDKRDSLLAKVYESFGFGSNKELIKALRLVEKERVAAEETTEEEAEVSEDAEETS